MSFSFGYLDGFQMRSLKKVFHECIAVLVGRTDQGRDLERGEGRFCFIGLRDLVNDWSPKQPLVDYSYQICPNRRAKQIKARNDSSTFYFKAGLPPVNLDTSENRRYLSPLPVTRSVQRVRSQIAESDSGCGFLFRLLCFFVFLLLTFCHDALLALMMLT
jgi:hypothetical protein